jgi:DNA helicase HerA-like ATPase
MSKETFKEHINKGYTFKKDFIVLGGAMFDGDPVLDAHVKIPLKSINRHGLIAGATGTGKTKTLQVFSEQLSENGIPSLLMDLKGDLSGLAKPGESNEHIAWRHISIGNLPYEPKPLPVELMTISDEKGVKLRATVSEFGPVLVSKILDLNDTQGGIIALVFKYCDDNALPLLDLEDLKDTINYLANEGKEEIEKEYGRVSTASISTIIRKIIELEQQGAERFFGEKSFDVNDLLRKDENGKGYQSIIRLTDVQDKPKLFSTFMLSLLSEIYTTFPEQGDTDEPKLVLFVDEAHLVFKEASKALLNQIEAIVKLIRSKGVGIYFCTQNPTDIPDAVLSQLGLKIQHALRAFTAKDRKAITKTVENYPISEFYDTETLITSLGIGEALVTCLNEKGIPTPLAATLLRAPITRMDVLEPKEIEELVNSSELVEKYQEDIERKSASEILTERIKKAQTEEHQKEIKEQHKKGRKAVNDDEGFFEELSKNTMVRQIGRTVFRELARGLLGALGIKR